MLGGPQASVVDIPTLNAFEWIDFIVRGEADWTFPALLNEIEEKSMVFTASAGQGLIKMGQSISVVPMMLTGTLKVSRENEDGHELVLYYVKAGEGCAMTFSCGMMSQPSQVKGTAEEDLSMLCVPVPVMEEWMQKYPSWKKICDGNHRKRIHDHH